MLYSQRIFNILASKLLYQIFLWYIQTTKWYTQLGVYPSRYYILLPSTDQSTHICIHPSTYPSIHPSIHPFICPNIHLFFQPSVHTSSHPSVYPSIHLPTIYPPNCPSIYPSIHLSICPSTYPSIHFRQEAGHNLSRLQVLYCRTNTEEQTASHTHNYGQVKEATWPNWHVFGYCAVTYLLWDSRDNHCTTVPPQILVSISVSGYETRVDVA